MSDIGDGGHNRPNSEVHACPRALLRKPQRARKHARKQESTLRCTHARVLCCVNRNAQAIRGDGPCVSGDSDGTGRECKFGYRGARETPSVAEEEESGWLEKPSMWHKGGPKDCMTCPVGFKVEPLSHSHASKKQDAPAPAQNAAFAPNSKPSTLAS